MPYSLENNPGRKAISDLVMPKLGLTMEEGTLSKWHVKPGDRVQPGQMMFVVETDKIANEIEAQSEGEIVEILVNSGETVSVGTPLARWTGKGVVGDEDNEAALAETPEAASVAREAVAAVPSKPATKAIAAGGRVKATPLARRIARQQDIDIDTISGSGPGGRIKKADVEAAIALAKASAPPTKASEHATAEIMTISAKHLAMARRVAAAKRDVPHFYLVRRAEISALAALRREINEASGPKITLNHFLLKAVGRALIVFPEASRIWSDDALLAYSGSDVGMVVSTPDGLFIPILRDVGRMPMDRLSLKAGALIERAREGILRREDLEGGVVSVSNLGMAGVESVAPIINPPQSAILGVGSVVETFRPDEAGHPVLRRELVLTLVCDHRAFDGMSGARFLEAIVHGLESPHGLLRTTNVEDN